MSTSAAFDARPGSIRDVPIAAALAELTGTLEGKVGLPARLFWSGPNPRAVRWDLGDPNRRRALYEMVLAEGTIDDIRRWVNPLALVRLWDTMFLPAWVRSEWQPLIEEQLRS